MFAWQNPHDYRLFEPLLFYIHPLHFLICAAFCLRWTIAAHSLQYLALLDFDRNTLRQTAHLFVASSRKTSALSDNPSLSSNNTHRKNLQMTEYEILCGQTQRSPSSSKRQLPSSQLQQILRMSFTASRRCPGVIHGREPSGFRSMGGNNLLLNMDISFV